MMPPPPPPAGSSPPIKKQRSTATPNKGDELSSTADRLIAQRRAALAKLREQQMGPSKTTGTTTQELLARAQRQIEHKRTAPPPQQQPVERVRHSDLFPSAQPKIARRLDQAFQGERSKSAPPQRPPPPPPPAPTSKEAPAKQVSIQSPTNYDIVDIPRALHTPDETIAKASAGHTPFHKESPERTNAGHTPWRAPSLTTTPEATPVKTDDSLYPKQQSPELRLTEQVVTLQREKQTFMTKVSQLEGEISRLKESKSMGSAQDLTLVVHMAETQGEAAALDWARNQVNEQKVGFLSPVVSILNSPKRRAASPAKGRAPTPYKRHSPPKPRQVSFKDIPGGVLFIKQAIECVQHVYETEDAVYTIRRPYGMEDDTDLWFSMGQLSNKLYEKQGDIHDATSLEVVAEVKYDGSKLVVYGDTNARLQNGRTEDWRNFGDVLATDEFLGSVPYVDENGEEQEYNLDDLLDAANSVRYTYSSSILSTADGLKQRGDAGPSVSLAPPLTPVNTLKSPFEASPIKAETSDTSVQTDELPEQAPPTPKRASKEAPPEAAPAKKSSPPPEPEKGDDILGQLLSMFISFLLSSLYTLFIGLPLRILSTTFVFIMAAVLVIFLKVQFIPEIGAGQVGGPLIGGGLYYNAPGIM